MLWKRLTKTHYASDCIQSFKGRASRGTTIQNNNKVVFFSLIQSICGTTWRKCYHCNLLLANTTFCNFSGKSLLIRNPEPMHWKSLPHSSNIKSKGNSQHSPNPSRLTFNTFLMPLIVEVNKDRTFWSSLR